MATWALRVRRYNKKTGENRISGTRHLQADGFAFAAARANDIVAGMYDANPECGFEIVSLLSHDYRGEDCEGGGHAFETREEFTARIEEIKP